MKIKVLFDEKFFKFILVGLLNTAFGTTIMFVLYNIFHVSYWISSATNYILGSILSYILNKNFTCKYKKNDFSSVLRFVLNIAVCYICAYGIAKPLAKAVLQNYTEKVRVNIAMIIGMCFFVGLNYLGQRFFAFVDTESTKGEENNE